MTARLIGGGLACDNRGNLRFVNDFDFTAAGIKRMYQVENNPLCEIRAWHGHLLEHKYVYCARGSAIIAAIKMGWDDVEVPSIDPARGAFPPQTFVLSALQPKVLHIPAGMANGFRMLEPGTILIFYSTSTLAESAQDDYRFPFEATDGTFDIEVR
jgi:dTDP-4-dehydrorhamnose 3,5-epimerase